MDTESKTFRITPAGRVYLRFLAAFNKGTAEDMREFIAEQYADHIIAEHGLDTIVNWHLETHEATGGMLIHKVFLTEEHYIIVIVKSKADNMLFIDKMKIEPQNPFKILEYFHEASPQGMGT